MRVLESSAAAEGRAALLDEGVHRLFKQLLAALGGGDVIIILENASKPFVHRQIDLICDAVLAPADIAAGAEVLAARR